MQHLSVGVFGNKELIKQLGKQGTVNDIIIYNHASSEGVFTYIAPASEERIHPLLQVINIIDVPVIASNEVSKELAEQIIAIDAFGFEKGFVISESDDMKKITRGTSLENFDFVRDERELKEKLKSAHPKAITGKLWAPVDNYFNVRSVGTVILSVVKGGTIRKHDKLIIQPLGREVLVKGIQSQDKDIEEAHAGMRVGLNLRGVDAEDLKRGYVVCKEATVSKKVVVNFSKSKYTKDTADKGNNILLSVGTQVIGGRIEDSGTEVAVALEQNAVYSPGQKCIIASTKPAMPRIIGSGIMK